MMQELIVYTAVVLSLTATVTGACAFITYRAIKYVVSDLEVEVRRSKLKLIKGGKDGPIDSSYKPGYTVVHERGRKVPESDT
jgi:hypothetical protein